MHHRRTLWELMGQHYHRRMEPFGTPYLMLTLGQPTIGYVHACAAAQWCGVVWCGVLTPPPFPFSPSPLLSCVCSDIEYVAQRWSMLTQHEEVPKAQPLNSYGSRTDRAALRLSVIDSYGGRCAVCPYASDCRVRLCVWVCGFVGLWVCGFVFTCCQLIPSRLRAASCPKTPKRFGPAKTPPCASASIWSLTATANLKLISRKSGSEFCGAVFTARTSQVHESRFLPLCAAVCMPPKKKTQNVPRGRTSFTTST